MLSVVNPRSALESWARAVQPAWQVSAPSPDADLVPEVTPPPEPELPFESGLAMLQAHLGELCASAASVVVAHYESAPDPEIAAMLKRATDLVVSALEALDIIDVLYVDLPASEIEEDGESSEDWDDRPSTPPIVAESIEDVLMLARMGLHSRARLLRAAETSSSWERLSVIGSAFRTIQKSLSAVDRVLSKAEAAPHTVRFHERALERSLEIRKRYVELAAFVLRGGTPVEGDVRDRLLSASAAISRTLGLPIAVHLRTNDRALLLTTRARLREWLIRDERTPDHLTVGLRLWQDLANVVTMFTEVNRREELLQHDARLVREVLSEVPHGALLWPADTRASVLRRLTAMRGRSPALDALLDAFPDTVAARDLRPILEDLDDSLAAVAILDPG